MADPIRLVVDNKRLKRLIRRVYLAAVRERYNRLSRGGGEWPPLSPVTIARKQSRSGSRLGGEPPSAILKDTGQLFNALEPGAPGNTFRDTPDGILVGIGGPVAHAGSTATMAQIAEFHQVGAGKLPARPIMFLPTESDPVVAQMMQVAGRIIDETAEGA